jgi:hypothetical protein
VASVSVYILEYWFLSVMPLYTAYKKVSSPLKEATGIWRKLHNEELHKLCSSPSIIRIIKSKSMRWAGHVARIGEKRTAYRILAGKPSK